MIRLGTIKDIQRIMTIVDETIVSMQKFKNLQWNHGYPSKNIFENDIRNENIYVYDELNVCVAFIVVDMNEPEPYFGLNWRSDLPHLNIHRFAVSSEHRKKGIASKLLDYTDTIASLKQLKYIKVDTNSKNIPMIKLLKKHKYKETDRVYFRNIPDEFICFDKLLT